VRIRVKANLEALRLNFLHRFYVNISYNSEVIQKEVTDIFSHSVTARIQYRNNKTLLNTLRLKASWEYGGAVTVW
jgi:hypothetical protein